MLLSISLLQQVMRCRVDFSTPKACIVTPVTARYGDVHVIFGWLKPKVAKMAGGGRYLGRKNVCFTSRTF